MTREIVAAYSPRGMTACETTRMIAGYEGARMVKIYTGFGSTIEEAVSAAAGAAADAWKPLGLDDQVELKLEDVGILYGGIVGHTGTRVARVSLPEVIAARLASHSAVNAATGSSVQPGIQLLLTLKLDVHPEVTWVNMMPPVRQPQPKDIALVFSVCNPTSKDYEGTSMDSAIARFEVYDGPRKIWSFPESVLDVVTPVHLRPKEVKTFTAKWHVDDVVALAHADLHAVARFVPTGDTAHAPIAFKSAF
jgi:hypothetical protein